MHITYICFEKQNFLKIFLKNHKRTPAGAYDSPEGKLRRGYFAEYFSKSSEQLLFRKTTGVDFSIA